MQLTCPKCHGDMRQYERSGVVIDQCGECRGIFLDRGELEKLFEAEANWNRQQSAGAPNPARPAQAPGACRYIWPSWHDVTTMPRSGTCWTRRTPRL
ncbi:zf-TFIIB domain-containing protein, partial [Micromonospora carbonacea]|uniref:TFIIB-type zinc ribbon-containing protein n=1 Tax=Micromonospora carbonacea TaxID=47853 RepID=UPI003407B529